MEHLEILAATLKDLLAAEDTEKALALISSVRPADAADLLEYLEDESLSKLVRIWDPHSAAETLSELEPSHKQAISGRLPPEVLADFLDVMSTDDAVAFLEEIDPDVRARILGLMERQEASEVVELLEFPEGTAGRIMSPDFFAVGEETSAERVISELRAVPEEVELVYYVYVLGGSEQLKGVASLRRLITAPPMTPVGQLMETDLVTVLPNDEEETVSDLVARYNLLAVPVVDSFGRMLGIVTVDDVLQTMEEEAEEDVFRFAGALAEDRSSTRAWPAIRRRIPWLAAATLIELAIAYAILRPLPTDLLVVTIAYVPLLVFVSGNTAVQAAARVLVRLVSGRTEAWSPWTQTRRELVAGVVLGVLAAGLSMPIFILLGRGIELSALVATSLGLSVFLGAGIGASLPVLLQRLKFDPAIASGPLLGSVMDVVSISIYLLLASALARALV